MSRFTLQGGSPVVGSLNRLKLIVAGTFQIINLATWQLRRSTHS